MNEQFTEQKPSLLHIALSFILPGLGQFLAGWRSRGITILLSMGVLYSLTVWSITQSARFPDFNLGLRIFTLLVIQGMALLLFLLAARRIFARYLIKDNVARSFAIYVLGILYAILTPLLAVPFLGLAGSSLASRDISPMTAVLSAGTIAALWFWQAADAGKLGALPVKSTAPGMGGLIGLTCILIFFLGYSLTGIDMAKAISEYTDTRIILSRIVWPWRRAFEFTQEVVEVKQRIQAPCPEGAAGPAPNEPDPANAWITVDITCGDLSVQDLQGNFTPGTELHISGGNFTPGQVVDLLWQNPIGNAFTPRGVGETKIEIRDDGTFESTLIIPQITVVSTAVGDQVHTLLIRESSEEVFTGNLSADMGLALVGIMESIMIGLMATFFGIILSFPLSFLAARNLMSPIVQPLGEVIGGLVGVVTGLVLAILGTSTLTKAVGGLDKAPLLIFPAFVILMLALGIGGLRTGTKTFKTLIERMSAGAGNLLSASGLVLAAAAVGYMLGVGFSRGIVAIPKTSEIAAETERYYALGGAILLGLYALYYALRVQARGEVKIGMFIYGAVRTTLNIIRSIEPLIWGLVAIIWIGPGPFAGTIALTLHTIAALAKLYSESIESIDSGPIEALNATGATRLQTIIYAVVPQILPPFISFTIYRWDINVRMSTVIGLVGGGGIGFILIQWIRLFQYDAAGLAVWLITITVATMDYVSSEIRERFV